MRIKFAIVGWLLVVTSQTVESAPPTEVAEATAAASMKEQRKEAANRQRRIIFNNDGAEPVIYMTQPSAQDFLAQRTSALTGTQVDTICYCSRSSGFGLFTHFTKVGDVFTSKEGRYANNQMEALLERGIDPLQVMVDFCKEHEIEIFWSMRMNDTHDGSRAEYAPLIFRASKLKNEHPEYLLSTIDRRPKHGAWSAVNYALPEVRELALRYFEEVCKNYDVDGIELDFFRHPVFYKSTSRGKPATDEELAGMTDLLRRIRTMADEVGKKRGRPILIAVKAPDSVEYAQAIGLDIEKWMADDLIDMYVPSGYFRLNDWKYSVDLGHRYGVKVYPSLDKSRVRDEAAKAMRSTGKAYRARAASAWAAGVDGIYIFNFFDPHAAMFHELGDPEKLAELDKDYFCSVRGARNGASGNLPFQSYLNAEILNPENPKTLSPGKTAIAKVQMGEIFDENSRANVKLRLLFKSSPNPKLVHATFNGQEIDLTPAKGRWLEATVPLSAVRSGSNRVELSLASDAPKKLSWTDLVVEVRH